MSDLPELLRLALGQQAPDGLAQPQGQYLAPGDAPTEPVALASRRVLPSVTGKAKGRPRAIDNPGLRATLLLGAERGYPIRTVFGACGVSDTTYFDWRKRAEAGEAPYHDFFCDLQAAVHRGKLEILGYVRASAQGAPDKDGIWKNQWQAGAWLAKTIWRNEFGDKATIEVETKSNAPTIDPRNLSDAELVQFTALLRKATTTAPEAVQTTEDHNNVDQGQADE